MIPFFKMISRGFGSLIGLFWPAHCALCGSRTERLPICEDCLSELECETARFCSECGGRHISNACRAHPSPLCPYFVPAFKFCDKTRDMIHLLKYSGRRDIGALLGEMVHTRISADGIIANADMLVPVPLHKIKHRDRGFNQSEVMADRISKLSGIPVLSRGVNRMKHTPSQTKLNAKERQANVAGVFEINIDLSGKKLIIIDDVITTGATIRELASAILRVGGQISCAACVAHPGLDD